MLVKAFELSCIRRQSLKFARLLENQSSNMKTLKALADPNLKHDAIAAMRHPRPHKRTSIHKASGKSQSSHQYASHLRRCIFVFQNCGVSHIGIFVKLEYCAAAKVSVDWVRASDVVAPQSPHDGRARDDDFFTSTEPGPPALHVFQQDGGWHWGITVPRSAGSGFKLIAFSTDIFSTEDTAQRDGDRALASIVATDVH